MGFPSILESEKSKGCNLKNALYGVTHYLLSIPLMGVTFILVYVDNIMITKDDLQGIETSKRYLLQ